MEELYELEVWPLQESAEKEVEYVSKYEHDTTKTTDDGFNIRRFLRGAVNDQCVYEAIVESKTLLAKCQVFAVNSKVAAWQNLPLWPVLVRNNSESSLDTNSNTLVGYLSKKAYESLKKDSEILGKETAETSLDRHKEGVCLLFENEKTEIVRLVLKFFELYDPSISMHRNDKLKEQFPLINPNEVKDLFDFCSRYQFRQLNEFVVPRVLQIFAKENSNRTLPEMLELSKEYLERIFRALKKEAVLEEFLGTIPRKKDIPVFKTSIVPQEGDVEGLAIDTGIMGVNFLAVNLNGCLKFLDIQTNTWSNAGLEGEKEEKYYYLKRGSI